MPKELNLNTDKEVLVVKVFDKEYQIPLASSLKVKEVKGLMALMKLEDDEKLNGFIDFFKNYIPEDVLDELPMKSLTELMNAWSESSDLGE